MIRKRRWWKINDKAAKRSGAAMISVIVLSVLLLGVSFILGRGGSSSVSDLYAANLPVRLAYFTLSVLMARWVIDDIFIASIPGKYGKAFNKAVKIKARYSFWQRLTQSYIREHLPQVYIKPYRSYMRFKRCVIVYYLLVFALLIVAAFLCDGKTVSVMWKVVTGIDVAISLFLLSRFDINRCTKFTRSK